MANPYPPQQQYPPQYPPPGQYPPQQPPNQLYPGLNYTGAPATAPVVVAQPRSKAWFDGYDPAVEENSTRRCCNFTLLLVVGFFVVASICCGVFVMRPGVEFQNFELGQCTLNKLKFKEYKGCSCGKNCRSSFPCYTMTGVFIANGSDSKSYNMQFFKSFWDFDTGCVWKQCERDKDANERNVYDTAVKFYKEFGYDWSKLKTEMDRPDEGTVIDTLDATKKLDCYGNKEDDAILEYINSAVWIGCGAIPLIIFVIVVAVFLKCATPGMKLSVSRWICFPCCMLKDSKNTPIYMCAMCNKA